MVDLVKWTFASLPITPSSIILCIVCFNAVFQYTAQLPQAPELFKDHEDDFFFCLRWTGCIQFYLSCFESNIYTNRDIMIKALKNDEASVFYGMSPLKVRSDPAFCQLVVLYAKHINAVKEQIPFHMLSEHPKILCTAIKRRTFDSYRVQVPTNLWRNPDFVFLWYRQFCKLHDNSLLPADLKKDREVCPAICKVSIGFYFINHGNMMQLSNGSVCQSDATQGRRALRVYDMAGMLLEKSQGITTVSTVEYFGC